MTTFNVSVGPPVTTTASGLAAATLFVAADDLAFPDNAWRDFPAVILEWWWQALDECRDAGSCSLKFMDGPYEVRVTRRDAMATLAFIARSAEGEATEREFMLPYDEFLHAMAMGFREAGICLDDSKWHDRADILEEEIRRR